MEPSASGGSVNHGCGRRISWSDGGLIEIERRRDVFMTCMYVIKLDSLDLAGNHVEKKAVQISRFGTGSGIGDGGLTN